MQVRGISDKACEGMSSTGMTIFSLKMPTFLRPRVDYGVVGHILN